MKVNYQNMFYLAVVNPIKGILYLDFDEIFLNKIKKSLCDEIIVDLVLAKEIEVLFVGKSDKGPKYTLSIGAIINKIIVAEERDEISKNFDSIVDLVNFVVTELINGEEYLLKNLFSPGDFTIIKNESEYVVKVHSESFTRDSKRLLFPLNQSDRTFPTFIDCIKFLVQYPNGEEIIFKHLPGEMEYGWDWNEDTWMGQPLI